MSAPFIRVVDLETTGSAPPEHVPIEIGYCDVVGNRDLLGAPTWTSARIAGAIHHSYLLKPARHIPPESSAIHHLVDADMVYAWPQDTRLPAVVNPRYARNDRIALAAHNAAFERQWLTPEITGDLPWICTWKCALRAWPDAPGHGNQVLRYWRRPEGLDRDRASPAHRAGPDAYVTAFLLRELLQLHALGTLIAWSAEPAVLIRVPFGKRPPYGSRGEKWSEVDEDLIRRTLERDFSADIHHTCRLELARREAAEPHDG